MVNVPCYVHFITLVYVAPIQSFDNVFVDQG